MKLTKRQEEIEKKVRSMSDRHDYFRLDPSKGIGGIVNWSINAKRANPITNNALNYSDLREIMTEKEYGDPAYNHLTYDRVCKECGTHLSYDERMGKICKKCAAKKAEAKKKEERAAALAALAQQAYQSVPATVTKTTVVEPVKSTVTFMTPEEQEKNVCRVSTLADLMQHAPDRAVVMVHIENYNVNNYYTKDENK